MEEKKSNGTKGAAKWKEVAIGGISGIALGTAGTLFASSIPFEASAENVDSENANTETEPTNTTAQMATHVTDSMSFSDAFNAAREEVTSSTHEPPQKYTLIRERIISLYWYPMILRHL